MRMRSLIAFLIAAIMLFSIAFAAPATKIELFIDYAMATLDGKSTPIDPDNLRVTPIIRDNRTLLPVRFIAENLGIEVYWAESSRTITLTGDKTIRLAIDDTKAYIDDKLEILDSPPIIFENRTYLPVRFISETLDKEVEWDELLRKVTITPKVPPVDPMELYEPIDILDGLVFHPIFPDGFAKTQLEQAESIAVEFSGNYYIIYGVTTDEDSEFFDQSTLNFFIEMPADAFPLTSSDAVIIKSTIMGKERFAIVKADRGFGEEATDMLQYLVYDEKLNLFVCIIVDGTDQEALDKLNMLAASFR